MLLVSNRRRFVGSVSVVVCGSSILGLLAGCSGSSGSGIPMTTGSTSTQTFGSFTTRAVGTAQAPVISASKGATVYGIAGASFTDITQGATESSTYVAPAGNKIAFERANDIFLMDLDGKNAKPITSRGSFYRPSWSKDGKKLAFDDNSSIYTVNADGTGFTLSPLGAGLVPRWSPDGKKLVFENNPNGSYDIFVMNSADGKQVLNLTKSSDNYNPSWSPDGTRVVYKHNNEIYTAKADGTGGITALTATGDYEDWPVYSPDGKKIAYWRNYDVYTMDANGLNQVNLTKSGGVDPNNPISWSPDGKKIIFNKSVPNSSMDIFVYDLTSNAVSDITASSTRDDNAPAYSPIATTTPVPPVVTTQKLIGTGVSPNPNGLLGTVAAGFFYSQLDKTVTSVLAFDTTTATVAGRAAARITPLTATETQAQNLIFSVVASDGGTLSTLSYANGSNPAASMTVGQNGAIITFSANDGTVTTILPYAATKSVGGKPQVTQSGDIATINGQFTGVWNGKGENIGTNGATLVRINTKNGALVDFK